MKKTISLLLALLLMSSCFTFNAPDAHAFGAVWVKEFYKDKFGDKTDQYYLTNKSQFKGTYNTDSVSNGKLGANLIFERDGEYLHAYITLFLKGKEQLKNGTSSGDSYDISVKRSDGSQFNTSGGMSAGEDRIKIDDTVDLASSLITSSGEISIYIEDHYNATVNFLFKAKCGNFKELYNQEVLIPLQEDRYQEAEELLKNKQFDEAASAFEALGDYKDSADRVAEVIEAKNADAYAKAEELLSQKKYDEATKAFKALGEYKDSADRVAEVIEAKNADAYAKAEELFSQKKYDDAINAFKALGDYKDSADLVKEVTEAKKADIYTQAKHLYDVGDYSKAYLLFLQISDFKDVNQILSTDRYILAAALLENYKTIGNIVEFGTFEQDNDTSNGKEAIEWIVLDTTGNKSLLLSKYGLVKMKFDSECSGVMTAFPWSESTLRTWLNESFFKEAFSVEEQNSIQETTHESGDYADRVFLLTIADQEKYINVLELWEMDETMGPAYAQTQIHYYDQDWWLRGGVSMGGRNYNGYATSAAGSYVVEGTQPWSELWVRPALWIDLESDIFKSP